MIIIPITLVLCFALLATASLTPPTRPAYLVGLYLWAYANIVLVSQIAGLLYQLNNPYVFVALHFILLFGAWLVWRYVGQPPLLGPFAQRPLIISKDSLWASLRAHPALWLLGIGVAGAYLVNAWLILNVPPNNGDSMEYHLTRVGYWLQYGSFFPWQTSDLRQTIYPINANVQVLWTVLFWGTDQLAGFVQWTAAPLSSMAIFGLARTLKWKQSQAMFAALIWMSFPIVVLQSTSTQTDLIAAALFISVVYLLYLGIFADNYQMLLLSGIAFGLSIGTKQTIFFALPGLCLAIGFFVIRLYNQYILKKLIVWSSACVLAAFLFGAYIYLTNWYFYDTPLGPDSITEAFAGSTTKIAQEYVLPTRAVINLMRYSYQFADFTGLPNVIATPVYKFKADIVATLLSRVGLPIKSNIFVHSYAKEWGFDLYWHPTIPPHEHNAGFGTVAFLFLLPMLVIQLLITIRWKDHYKAGLFFILISVVIGISASRNWGGTEMRYLMMGFVVCSPFFASIYDNNKGILSRFIHWSAIIFAIVTLWWTTTHNYSKPLFGNRAIWGQNRIELQNINYKLLEPAVQAVEKFVPQNATIGFVGFSRNYMLFGEQFSRTVIEVIPHSKLTDASWLRNQGVNYLLVCSPTPLSISEDFGLIGVFNEPRTHECKLLQRNLDKFQNWPDELKTTLLDSTQVPVTAPLLTISETLGKTAGANPAFVTARWGLEQQGQSSVLWLGQGWAEGLKTILWSTQEQSIRISFNIAPGPARSDDIRTIEFELENRFGAKQSRHQINRPVEINLVVKLQPGPNFIHLSVLDEPTILTQPNGDTRSLLALLRGITITSPSAPQQIVHPLIDFGETISTTTNLTDVPITPPWAVEQNERGNWLWLGHGLNEGFGFTLSSSRHQRIAVALEVTPGPGREDKERTIELNLQNEAGSQSTQMQFDQATTLELPVQLKTGENTVRISVLDEATILKQANGDTRPLLVRLNQITVTALEDTP